MEIIIDPDIRKLPIGYRTKRRHAGCTESNALSIEVRADGINIHCFKCGAHKFIPHEGQSFNERRARVKAYEEVQKERERAGFDLPADFSHTIAPDGLAWLGAGGWTQRLIEKHGIGWSDKLKRVVIPISPAGYTARAVLAGQRPKYLEKAPSGASWKSYDVLDNSKPLVVVEDALSAGRVGEFRQAYAMLGTGQWHAPFGVQSVIIWTDNDSAGRKCRGGIETVCRWMDLEYRHIHTEKDPKKYSNLEIKELLCV